MLHAGLDLSRHRLDVHLLDAQGSTVQVATAPPDADGCGPPAISLFTGAVGNPQGRSRTGGTKWHTIC
jgi:hypothetical protein